MSGNRQNISAVGTKECNTVILISAVRDVIPKILILSSIELNWLNRNVLNFPIMLYKQAVGVAAGVTAIHTTSRVHPSGLQAGR
jgi:hypothetical protein